MKRPENFVATLLPVIIVTIMFCSEDAIAQRQTVNQWNSWYISTGSHSLGNKFNLLTDLQMRLSGPVAESQQLLIRLAPEYRLSNDVSVAAGYCWVRTWPYGKQPALHLFDESRIWQQIQIKQSIGNSGLTHRYRIEQRWLEMYAREDDAVVKKGINFQYRFRYRIQFEIPVKGKPGEKGTLTLPLFSETFINAGEKVRYNIFDQHRAGILLGWQFQQSGRLLAGYQNQLLQKADGIRRENNHTLMAQLVYNFNLINPN